MIRVKNGCFLNPESVYIVNIDVVMSKGMCALFISTCPKAEVEAGEYNDIMGGNHDI